MTKTVLELFREKAIAAQVAVLEAEAIAIGHKRVLLDNFRTEVWREFDKHFNKRRGMFEFKGTAHDGVYEFKSHHMTYVDYNVDMWVTVTPVEFTKAKKRKVAVEERYFNLEFILKNAVEVDPKDYIGKTAK